MELEHIGKHCSHEGCNMKDFLPFKCNICSGTFCLDHRTYASHSCSGAFSRDKNSIECPMCKKSLRLTKADSPDEVWQQHYFNGCNHGDGPSTSVSPVKKCARENCRVALGVSNTMTCSKCLKVVCLTHRLPEDHNCQKLASSTDNSRREEAARRAAALAATVKPTTNKKPTGGGGGGGASKFKQGPSVYDTAEHRRPASSSATSFSNAGSNGVGPGSSSASHPPPAPVAPTTAISGESNGKHDALPPPGERGEVFVCPSCAPGAPQGTFSDAVQLLAHMDQGVHVGSVAAPPVPATVPNNVATPGASGGSGGEVCPQCSARFGDVMELIAHVESAHSSAAVGGGSYSGAINNRSTGGNSGNSRNNSGGCIPS